MISLADGVVLPETAAGARPPFQPLAELPLTILVGVTGVGKSTALRALQAAGCPFTLLPDRRVVADRAIIAALQRQDGQAVRPITDRRRRFEYTARYRRLHPGGMAHALARLWVDPGKVRRPLVFDGLRGLDEVRHALGAFPRSRFIVLDAPDLVRVRRLLKRADGFDATDLAASTASRSLVDALREIPGIDAVFDLQEIRAIAGLVNAGPAGISADDVAKKVAIVVAERRNYDPQAAKSYLARALPPDRCLVIDTGAHPPQSVAEQIAAWL
ncbi:MAG: ATPase [Anaerolineae bacterium]